jgi:hypothetical protein
MRIYNDPMEMVKEVERDLYEMGIRYQSETVQDRVVRGDPNYETIELTAYTYALTDVSYVTPILDYLGGNLDWAKREVRERINGSLNPGFAWLSDKDRWSPFLRDGIFAYHYPERLVYQLDLVIRELKTRPNTRQAVMTMYDVHQDVMNWGGRDRVPCSLTYHFMLRRGRLCLIYSQRSCDFLKFFSTDVWITCEILKYVARSLRVPVDRFIHSINSLHAFRKDMDERGVF